MPRINFTSKKTLIIIGVIALIVVLGGAFAFVKIKDSNKPLPTSADQPTNTVNLNPPTEEEKSAADERKDAIVNEQNSNTQTPAGSKKQVVPVITNASQSGVNSYISGVFEEGGTCTATYIQGAAKFTKGSIGFADATTTNCAPISTTRSDFPASGEWLVTIMYSSAAAEGSSAAKAFTVQ